MSRERPTKLPRPVPSTNPQIEDRKARQREAAERLKSFSGPAMMGYLAATFTKGNLKRAPVMIRRGYEASILDDLNDFFTWRGWRPKRSRPKNITHKDRQNRLRRALAAGVIVKLGRGRWGLAKVAPHPGPRVGVGQEGIE